MISEYTDNVLIDYLLSTYYLLIIMINHSSLNDPFYERYLLLQGDNYKSIGFTY